MSPIRLQSATLVYTLTPHIVYPTDMRTKTTKWPDTEGDRSRAARRARVGVATDLGQNSSGTSLSPRAAAMASGNSRQNASTHSLGTVVLTLTKREPNLGV
jgi:hypothetical protein